MTINFPYRTAYQTLENSQGTLDPLGLYSIADRLATRLAPGLRERMRHPRYLTAIAVGAVACSSFEEDILAADEISAPWQVYEWYVVCALIRCFEKRDPRQLLGMPGRDKASLAHRNNIPLSATNYLKTPSVFGFHGIYRTLAKNIKLLEGQHTGDFGARLVDVWEQEQGLDGFLAGTKGTPGAELKSKLQEAILRGLERGAVAKPWTWATFDKLATVLAPKSPGTRESELILEQLKNDATGSREVLIDFFLSKEGRAYSGTSEKQWHQLLLQKNGTHQALLKAIMAYERVCRLLYNAFYEVLQWMQQHQSKGRLQDFCKLGHVKRACMQLAEVCKQADEWLSGFPEEADLFLSHFQVLRDRLTPEEWLPLLFDYHVQVQDNKPPNGKVAWILEQENGTYLLNTTQDLGQNLSDEYVHQYRTFTLQSFLLDLGKI